jgi:hypothetical protein
MLAQDREFAPAMVVEPAPQSPRRGMEILASELMFDGHFPQARGAEP